MKKITPFLAIVFTCILLVIINESFEIENFFVFAFMIMIASMLLSRKIHSSNF